MTTLYLSIKRISHQLSRCGVVISMREYAAELRLFVRKASEKQGFFITQHIMFFIILFCSSETADPDQWLHTQLHSNQFAFTR